MTPLTSTVSTQIPAVWNMTLRCTFSQMLPLVKTRIAHASPTAPRSPPHVATSASLHGIRSRPEKFMIAYAVMTSTPRMSVALVYTTRSCHTSVPRLAWQSASQSLPRSATIMMPAITKMSVLPK